MSGEALIEIADSAHGDVHVHADTGEELVMIRVGAALDEAMKAFVAAVLARHRGNIAAAARQLAIPRRTMQRRMDKLGIPRAAAAAKED